MTLRILHCRHGRPVFLLCFHRGGIGAGYIAAHKGCRGQVLKRFRQFDGQNGEK
ncbi:MAG: hypothetical protein H0T75_09600 [Rhizobiales bacterium]|nr:hypothetical protein [Hyphomicrobiales bacterium]